MILKDSMRLLLLTCLSATACAAVANAPVVIEAESVSGGDPAIVIEATALGKKAVQQAAAFHPLFRHAVPAGLPHITVWARHRHGPIQLKSEPVAGGQVELAWSWANSAEWTWARLGELDTKEIKGIIIIRGDASNGPATELDQVVMDPTGTWKP